MQLFIADALNVALTVVLKLTSLFINSLGHNVFSGKLFLNLNTCKDQHGSLGFPLGGEDFRQ